MDGKKEGEDIKVKGIQKEWFWFSGMIKQTKNGGRWLLEKQYCSTGNVAPFGKLLGFGLSDWSVSLYTWESEQFGHMEYHFCVSIFNSNAPNPFTFKIKMCTKDGRP